MANILKFSVAKNVNTIVYAEASSDRQDITIYKSFFHLISNGIERLDITHDIAKNHLTSLNFVTKLNNDCGEQLADLLGKSGKHKKLIKEGMLNKDDLDKFDEILLEVLEKRLFVSPKHSLSKVKEVIYPEINSFKEV